MLYGILSISNDKEILDVFIPCIPRILWEAGVATYMLNLRPHPHGRGRGWSNQQDHLEGQALLQQPAERREIERERVHFHSQIQLIHSFIWLLVFSKLEEMKIKVFEDKKD